MKHIQLVPVILVLGLSALVSSCSAPGPSSAATTASPAVVQVDEGLLTVDVTVRRSLLDPDGKKSDEQIIQAAKDKGMSAAVNPNQTVTYTMTRARQRAMLDEMRTSMQQSVVTIVDDSNNSITGVDHNQDMTVFTVKVDGKRYNQFEAMYALVFYVQGAMFQQFSGVNTDNLDVKVQFVDDKSGQVINSSSYRDMLKRQSG